MSAECGPFKTSPADRIARTASKGVRPNRDRSAGMTGEGRGVCARSHAAGSWMASAFAFYPTLYDYLRNMALGTMRTRSIPLLNGYRLPTAYAALLRS